MFSQPGLDFIVVCDNASLGKDRKLSLIGIFDAVNSQGLPAVASFSAAARYRGLRGRFKYRWSVKDISDRDIAPSEEESADTGENSEGWQGIVNVQGVLLKYQGPYYVSLEINGREVGRAYFNLVVKPVPVSG